MTGQGKKRGASLCVILFVLLVAGCGKSEDKRNATATLPSGKESASELIELLHDEDTTVRSKAAFYLAAYLRDGCERGSTRSDIAVAGSRQRRPESGGQGFGRRC